MQRGYALGIRLRLKQSVAVEKFNIGDAIRSGTSMDSIQAFHLDVVRRNNDLSALFECDIVFACEVEQQRDTSPAEQSLETAGLIVEACMNNAGIVASLMCSRVVFLF